MVTRETAFRLKYADFEQPELKFGQVWYSENNGAALGFIQNSQRPFYPLLFQNIGNEGPVYFSKTKDLAYAPTAADILPLLPSAYRVVGGRALGFAVYTRAEEDAAAAVEMHKDLDEALAQKWLELNEKK